MQNLIKLIQQAKKLNGSESYLLNLIREYLQVLSLKAIYHSKYGRGLSFVGGTCLRICRGLKRFSEDLDFNYDQKIPRYDFSELNHFVSDFLKQSGFFVEVAVSKNKVVQKSFIKFSQVLQRFQLTALKSQKLHIKLEIDTNPPQIEPADRETFFVTQFNELFPILKHTDRTLFAGKIAAILTRPYPKGRDFYDLIWYLKQSIQPNLRYLNCCLSQMQNLVLFEDTASVAKALKKRMESVPVQVILNDLKPFLEDTEEHKILESYPILFKQLILNFVNGN